jgi:predicted phosphodiesterase
MVSVRTVVVSDLHLSTTSGRDLLRHAEPRAALRDRVKGADHVVLLGDVVELRQTPLDVALTEAEPFFRELGRAAGGAPVTIVAGNHDHRLAAPLLDAQRADGLPVDAQAPVPDSGPLARIAGWLSPAELRLSYPGLWIRDDVYATHGHYMDCHVTVPTIERLAVAVSQRRIGGLPDAARTPADYEAALGPLYELSHRFAQAAGLSGLRRRIGGGVSVGLWKQLGSNPDGRPSAAARALSEVAIPGAVAGLNALGLGPFEPDLSGEALRRSGLRSMATVIERLGIVADHVIFGHTHRSGPWPYDDAAEWALPGGGRLINTGSWIHEPAFLGDPPHEGPYWPGTCVVVEDDEPPRLERLLDTVPAVLEPPATET